MAQAFIKIELKEGKVEMNMEGMTGELADLLIGALGRVIAGCSPEVRGDLLEDVTAAIPKAVKVALDDGRPSHGVSHSISDETVKRMVFGAFMKALLGASGGGFVTYNLVAQRSNGGRS